MFSHLGSMTHFENFHFFSTPSDGGWGKKFLFKICSKSSFLCLDIPSPPPWGIGLTLGGGEGPKDPKLSKILNSLNWKFKSSIKFSSTIFNFGPLKGWFLPIQAPNQVFAECVTTFPCSLFLSCNCLQC